MNFLDSFDQFLRRSLPHRATRPLRSIFVRSKAVLVHSQEQDFAVRGLVPNHSFHLVCRTTENVRAGNNHVRTLLEHSSECSGSIARLCYNLHVRLVCKQAPQTLPQQDMVVNQDAANPLIAERSFSLYRCERVHSFLLGGNKQIYGKRPEQKLK